jgi:TP901 family phage tail tape measure protein
VEATEAEFGVLQKGIRDMAMELPASATEIAGVAEAAGQLGIANENILGFTRTMIDLGEATNLTAQDAATQLARLANITQMPQSQFDRLGSSIVAVGNNFATTEAEIVEMAMRLGGVGKQVGMTQAQIIGISGALSSVGVEAEAGGSAFSRVLSQMQLAVETKGAALNDFAAVAGMTAEEFARKFREDAAGALVAFIQGLGRVQERGGTAIKVLDDMGISEIRLRDALLRTAGAGDLLADAISLSSEAWGENTALSKESQQRYATLASQLKIMRNHITELAIEFGEALAPYIKKASDKVKEITAWFRQLDPEAKQNILRWAGIAIAIGPAIIMFVKATQAITAIHSAGVILGPILSGVAVKLGLVTAAGATATAATTAVGAASGAAVAPVTALGVATKFLLGPWGLLIAGIGAFVYAAAKIDWPAENAAQKIQRMEREAATAAGTLAGDLAPSIYGVVDAMNELNGVSPTIRPNKGLGVGNQRAKVAGELELAYEERQTKKAAEEAMEAARKATEDALKGLGDFALPGMGGDSTWLDSVKEKISAIGTEIDISRAKFDLLIGELEPTGDETKSLNLKLEQEQEELKLVGDQVSTLSDAVNRMASEQGIAGAETRKLTKDLLDAKLAYQDLQASIAATTAELEKQALIKKGLVWQAEGRMGTKAELNEWAASQYIQRQIDAGKEIEFGRLDKLFDNPIGMALGGTITEPILGLGLLSGLAYAFGERGPERVTPVGQAGSQPITITENVYIYGNADRREVSRGLDDSNMRLVQRLRIAKPGVI